MVALLDGAVRPRTSGGVAVPDLARARGRAAEGSRARAVPRVRRALGEVAWLAAVAACAFAVVFAFGLVVSRSEVRPVPDSTAVVPVDGADTLPEIAARFAPASDQRAVIDRIVELNRLDAVRPATAGSLVVPVQRG